MLRVSLVKTSPLCSAVLLYEGLSKKLSSQQGHNSDHAAHDIQTAPTLQQTLTWMCSTSAPFPLVKKNQNTKVSIPALDVESKTGAGAKARFHHWEQRYAQMHSWVHLTYLKTLNWKIQVLRCGALKGGSFRVKQNIYIVYFSSKFRIIFWERDAAFHI